MRERYAWAGVVILYVLGDVTTTMLGLQLGAIEKNALGAMMLQSWGLWGMAVGKAAAVGLGAAVFVVLPRPHRIGIPMGLCLVGACVTVLNAVVIATLV